ncbi:protein adenylyltransferase SelO [Macrococcoides caseolyticum]|uniref:protein adenylyltransferase SelO n=1 Tax=Macrococcoides caseolyticum TaxID=69966 RepID=UPI000C34DE9C|nr:YdiU family protein [Macrococcus caseolyticus]PKE49689.1 YdiU family protein [Macrococcus caseolyticus]
MNFFNFDTTYTNLNEIFYVINNPNPFPHPEYVLFNDGLARELNISFQLKAHPEILTGRTVIEGTAPFSTAYAGHQFGNFTMLGDGRQHILGEHITPQNKRYDIQLKGSGRTHFSRSGDGKATIRPMLREYIISEAMHHLNIPTTRSLAICSTGEKVLRESMLPGAVLTRTANSNIRVGTFEYAARTAHKHLKELADYTIERHFPNLMSTKNKYLNLLDIVIDKQARLIAQWQSIGFIHGVMNTDNMMVSGETIDYGPCAFMDYYHTYTVFSSIDIQGRYAYINQPAIALWNLTRFTEALLPLIHTDGKEAIRLAESTLDKFQHSYMVYYRTLMGQTIGIKSPSEEDMILIDELLLLMEQYEMDYTNTFLNLQSEDISSLEPLSSWITKWKKRLKVEKNPIQLMRKVNPVVIPRNHIVEEALDDAIHGDLSTVKALLQVLSQPFNSEHADKYKHPGPKDKPYQTFCGT